MSVHVAIVSMKDTRLRSEAEAWCRWSQSDEGNEKHPVHIARLVLRMLKWVRADERSTGVGFRRQRDIVAVT